MLWGPPRSSAQQAEDATGRKSISDLIRATPGSAGLDLSSSAYTVLTPDMGPQALPTGVYGPLPSGTVGLLLGRSSWSLKGLQVLPGVIDADYTGEIKIMVNSPTYVTTVPSGSRIAQLVLIPSVAVGKVMNTEGRGDQGFGSSDVYWMQPVGEQRPTLALRVN